MEPPDLNSPSDDDRRLEARLQQAQPELPDHGFSTRVLLALPPRRSVRLGQERIWVCAIGALTGLLVALSRGVSWSALADGLAQLQATEPKILAMLGDPMILLALAVTGLSLLFAFQFHAWEKRIFRS
jgi:hypothetical protein